MPILIFVMQKECPNFPGVLHHYLDLQVSFPFKYPYQSYQELASPFVQVALYPGLNNLRLASSLAEKTRVSMLPSSSSFQRTKHSPFLLGHKDHINAPEPTNFLAEVVWANTHITARAPKSVIPRVL